MMRLLQVALDCLLPGVGTALRGNLSAGAVALVVWTVMAQGLVVAACLGAVHLVRAGLALAVLWAGIELFLALSPGSGRSSWRLAAILASVAVAADLGCFLALSRQYAVVTVPDYAFFPGLLPGERVLISRLRHKDELRPGDIVYADLEPSPVLARVAGLPGHEVDVSGPSMAISGVVVAIRDQGEVQVDGSVDAPPEETDGLLALEEFLGGGGHFVFYRRGAEGRPTRQLVPEGHVFLIADNRSTRYAVDSRSIASVPVDRVVGRLGPVVWSRGRLDRIGVQWR